MSSVSSELILKGLKLGSTAAKIASLYLKLIYSLLREIDEDTKTYIYLEIREALKKFIKHYYLTYKIYVKMERILLEQKNYEYSKYLLKLREILNEMGIIVLQNKILNYLSKTTSIKGTNIYYLIKKIIQERPKVNN